MKDSREYETERFKLSPSKDKSGWVVADKENLIVIKWIDKKFNDTQEVVTLEDFDPNKFQSLARFMREIGDWLAVNHPEKLF
ncbi:MAG: hypothetical protein IM618_11120 [Cytophagales bacterium]|jgi:hypothetical protein|nr:hypothetical protein [Cytophagales bacterium]